MRRLGSVSRRQRTAGIARHSLPASVGLLGVWSSDGRRTDVFLSWVEIRHQGSLLVPALGTRKQQSQGKDLYFWVSWERVGGRHLALQGTEKRNPAAVALDRCPRSYRRRCEAGGRRRSKLQLSQLDGKLRRHGPRRGAPWSRDKRYTGRAQTL